MSTTLIARFSIIKTINFHGLHTNLKSALLLNYALDYKFENIVWSYFKEALPQLKLVNNLDKLMHSLTHCVLLSPLCSFIPFVNQLNIIRKIKKKQNSAWISQSKHIFVASSGEKNLWCSKETNTNNKKKNQVEART